MKTGIAGCGNIFNLAYKPIVGKVDGLEIVAFCDINGEKAKKASEDLGVGKYYRDAEEMLKAESLELLILCTPTYTHKDLAIMGLEHGVNVITEKPIATNVEEANKMLEASRANKRNLFVALARRFDPRWRKIKEEIDSKKIGEIFFIKRSECAGASFPPGSWYMDPDKGGGVLLDVGIHCADLFNWYFASTPSLVKAWGVSDNSENGKKGCIVFASVYVEYENKASGIFEVSWMHPKAYAPFYSDITIWGTGGKIEYSDKNTNPMLSVSDKVAEFPRYFPMMSSPPVTFQNEIQHFIDCIREGTEPEVTAEDAISALETIEKAHSCFVYR